MIRLNEDVGFFEGYFLVVDEPDESVNLDESYLDASADLMNISNNSSEIEFDDHLDRLAQEVIDLEDMDMDLNETGYGSTTESD